MLHLLAFAAGSGITPILSILKTELARDAGCQFTLVYSNHGINTVMFKEELEDLKNLHMSRLNLVHIFTDGNQQTSLFNGRLNKKKCKQLFKYWLNINNVTSTFICGPGPMMSEVSKSLIQHGMKKEFIHMEYFKNERSAGLEKSLNLQADFSAYNGSVDAKIILDGAVRSFSCNKNISLLQAALENNVDAPYACRSGICSTCKAKLLGGEVEMLLNNSLEDHEVERGFVLTCQAYPKSQKLTWDYDQG